MFKGGPHLLKYKGIQLSTIKILESQFSYFSFENIFALTEEGGRAQGRVQGEERGWQYSSVSSAK